MDEFQTLRASILELSPGLTEEAWLFLREGLTLKHYRKKENFLEAGSPHPALGFVTSGLLRGYFTNENGEEQTMRFVGPGGYATHYSAFLTQSPSTYTFQCLEESGLILLPFEIIHEAYDRFHSLERLGRKIAEEVLIAQRRRIESFQFLNAEERYLQFLEAYPDLFQKVSLTHLSSYLGIQRPSLSRIRKQLSEK